MACAVLIMKNVLPSFPMNQHDAEPQVEPALLSLLEGLSFVNSGDGKRAGLLVASRQTYTCVFGPTGRKGKPSLSGFHNIFDTI